MSGPFDPISSPAQWVRLLRSALPGAGVEMRPDASPPSRRATLCMRHASLVKPEQRRAMVLVSLDHVEHHEIVRVAGLVSHHLRLIGGAELHYAYNKHGELIELSGKNVATLAVGDQLMVQPLPLR